MHILYVNKEAQVQALQPQSVLVPPDRITSIRIRYFILRLAKSEVFTPRFWDKQYVVDQYIAFLKEQQDLSRTQTGTNNLTQLEKKYSGKQETEWDSGFSDG